MANKTPTAVIECRWCKKSGCMTFRRVYTSHKAHWEGECPACGEKNYIYRPSWDQLPIFRKYRREYISEEVGYTREHICRVATEKSPLTREFKDRCCYKLGETEEALFGRSEN